MQLGKHHMAVIRSSQSALTPTMSSILLTEAARTGSFSFSLDRTTCASCDVSPACYDSTPRAVQLQAELYD